MHLGTILSAFIVILRLRTRVLAKHLRDKSSHVLFPEDMPTRTSCLASFGGLYEYWSTELNASSAYLYSISQKMAICRQMSDHKRELDERLRVVWLTRCDSSAVPYACIFPNVFGANSYDSLCQVFTCEILSTAAQNHAY